MTVVADEHDPVAGGDAEHGDEPDQRSQRQHGPVRRRWRHRRSARTGSSTRRRHHRADPKSTCSTAGCAAVTPGRGQRAGAATRRVPVLTEHLRVVAGVEAHAVAAWISRATAPRSRSRTLQVTSIRREPPSRDLVRRRHDLHAGHRRQRRITAAARSTGSRRSANRSSRTAAADHHVEDLLRVEDFATFTPRSIVATVSRTAAGVTPSCWARSRSNATSTCGTSVRACTLTSAAPRTPAIAFPTSPPSAAARRAPARRSHHDRGARAGQHLLDPLAQIGQQIRWRPG